MGVDGRSGVEQAGRGVAARVVWPRGRQQTCHLPSGWTTEVKRQRRRRASLAPGGDHSPDAELVERVSVSVCAVEGEPRTGLTPVSAGWR